MLAFCSFLRFPVHFCRQKLVKILVKTKNECGKTKVDWYLFGAKQIMLFYTCILKKINAVFTDAELEKEVLLTCFYYKLMYCF